MTPTSSQYFREKASAWDSIRAGYFNEAVRSAAIAKAYLTPGMVAADVGAGTGFIAAGLAPLVRRVYVVDGSPEMLAEARRNLKAFANVEFHEADGVSLPFPDESLDAVFANMYLHHMVDPLAAIREMVRVLRPGGRLVITDMDAHLYAWMKEEMADVWQGFEREQVRAWFREAGLVNLIVDGIGQTCQAQSTAVKAADCDCSTAPDAGGCDCAGEGQAQVDIFLATGTRRMTMREAVETHYSAAAQSSSCGCSPEPAASQSTETAACCGGTTGAGSAAGSEQTAAACCGGSTAQGRSTDQGGSACCSPASPVDILPDYSAEELASAPREAAEIPLGCGNPVAIANLKPGETVLDIGSGGGLDSFLSAGQVGPEGRVIGVDMTPAMLERARAAAQRAGITNVEFRQGFAEALPVEDGMVDVILSNCVINLTEDKGQVFREAYRALKPGGRLEVSDIVLSGPVPIEAREHELGWAACVTGALPELEYLDLVAQAGFKQIEVRRSPSAGETFGAAVYSATVSARKE